MLVTFADAIRSVQEETLTNDPDARLLSEMVRVSPQCGGLLDVFGPERVLEVTVADRSTLGLAVGMALGGRTVIVEISSTGRLPAVFEVLADAAAIARRGDFAMNLVIRVPYGHDAEGLDTPIGQTLHRIPGLEILCPSDAGQAAGLFRAALQSGRPTLFLEPRALYGDRAQTTPSPVPLSARRLRAGSHVTLAAWGTGVRAALDAAESLANQGIEADVLDLVSLSAGNQSLLSESVTQTGRLVVVHPEDPVVADAIHQIALASAFLYLESPLAQARDTADSVLSAAQASITY
jgi:pyruvate/2-oxoglutarate/acetoin dehydrogenase E1 component